MWLLVLLSMTFEGAVKYLGASSDICIILNQPSSIKRNRKKVKSVSPLKCFNAKDELIYSMKRALKHNCTNCEFPSHKVC